MATRNFARYVSRRFSSGGKVLSEEEKAAENVYIKKTEQAKLEKLAQKAPHLETYFGKIYVKFPVHNSPDHVVVEVFSNSELPLSGPKPEEKPATTSGGGGDAKPSGSAPTAGASTEKVSTDKYRNYAVVAGTLTGLGALGWYLKSRGKKEEEVQD
ncbi:hypothetical protein Pint_31877 [Pistacia integerrima]|uniref:Uncharacterized protein n=1 Tax=Pistacia integerrima TaxID=434235 RepID=A0ACC0XRM1_9ROSI|nr:hypothetical protein Pint_31877 [Pistacia integerrima]